MATTPLNALRYPVGTDSPNIAVYFQNLATDVDGALPKDWVAAATGAVGYDAVPSGGALPQFSVSVTVPSGRTLDVEWSAPRVVVNANGTVGLTLQIAGANVDSADYVAGTVGFTAPAKLAGSFIGTGASVTVAVIAASVGGGGRIQASTTLGPRLRYRIV